MWFGEGRWGVAERGVVGRGVVERGGGVVEWGGREWEGEEGKKGGVPPLFHAVEETRKIPDTLLQEPLLSQHEHSQRTEDYD